MSPCSLRYMIEFYIDETRLASLDLPPKPTIKKRAIVLDPSDARPSCIALLIVNVHGSLAASRAFNNQPAGVKHRPARPAARCTQDSLPVLERCKLSAARPRPLLVSSRLDNQSALELLSLPACCCAREQKQLFLLSGTLESSIHPAPAAACPRQPAGFLEHPS
jgi:hypothetical protein